MIPCLGLLVNGLTGIARPVSGQVIVAAPSLDSLKAGERVRLWSDPPVVDGKSVNLVTLHGGILTVRRATTSDSSADLRHEIPVSTLRRVDVYRGQRRTAGFGLVAVVGGFAAGALVGSLAGMVFDSTYPNSDMVGLIIVTPAGALAGTVAGSVIAARGRAVWVPVRIPIG